MDSMQQLRAFIVKRRTDLGLTQRGLAKAAGDMNPGTISSIEAGKVTKSPSISTLDRLSDALRLPSGILRDLAAGKISIEQALQSVETGKPWPLHDLSQPSSPKASSRHGLANQDETTRNLSSVGDRSNVASEREDMDIPGAVSISGWVRLPVYGIGSCGDPMFLEDMPEGWEILPNFIGDGADGILRARGLSMVGNGIKEGDMIVFRRLDGGRPTPGKEVIASVDGQCTVKIYKVSQNFEYLESSPGSGTPSVIPIDASVRLVAQVIWIVSPR